MIAIILNLGALFFALLITEYLWKNKQIKGENARKIMHIFGGVLAATWPFYLSWRSAQIIIGLAVLFIIVMRLTGLFRSVYDVKRQTLGDFTGPLSIGILVFFEPSTVIFVATVLHIALADGLAAIIGTRYGIDNSYHILGYRKSIAGSAAFFVTSLAIMCGVFVFGNMSDVSPLALLVIPLTTTLIENIGVWGMDNALIALNVITQLYLFGIV
jgi:phytol kinase